MTEAMHRLAALVLLVVVLAAQPSVGQGQDASRCPCPEGFVAECSGPVNVTLARTMSGCWCVATSNGQQTADTPCLEASGSGNAAEGNGSNGAEENGSNGAEDDSCNCTREFIPQCNAAGEEIASNECIRNCMGFTRQEVNFLNCGLVSPEEYFAEFYDGEDEVDEDTRSVVDLPLVPENDTRGADNNGIEQATCEDTCERTTEWVCDKHGSRLAASACAAECKGYAPDTFSSEYCSSAYRDNALCGCTPKTDDQPICNSMAQEMAPNSCVAQCLGYTSPNFTAANCNATVPFSICGFIYSPLCDAKGSIWADNLCVANTLYPEEVVEELQEPFCAPEVRENAACGCTDEPQPVCDSLWTEIASSPCLADCLGYKEWQPCVNQFQPLIAPPENNGVIELPPGTDNETASDRSPPPDLLPPIEPADSAASTTSWVLAQGVVSALCICLFML